MYNVFVVFQVVANDDEAQVELGPRHDFVKFARDQNYLERE